MEADLDPEADMEEEEAADDIHRAAKSNSDEGELESRAPAQSPAFSAQNILFPIDIHHSHAILIQSRVTMMMHMMVLRIMRRPFALERATSLTTMRTSEVGKGILSVRSNELPGTIWRLGWAIGRASMFA